MTLLSEAVPGCSPGLQTLVKDAKDLYKEHFGSCDKTVAVVAPGRVNLIGEHTDYTGGFVFPLAIDFSTVIYGSGKVVESECTASTISIVSKNQPSKSITVTLDKDQSPPSEEEARKSWTWYVVGVVAQYLPDLPDGTVVDLTMTVAGNVPLGSGLSSSASLEVATARFLEEIIPLPDFSSKTRALRCQKAENVWCHSPCGIMDQYVSSAAPPGSLLLIDCTSYEYQPIQMKEPNSVVLVITNSNVQHSIGAGEYPVRVRQCKTATEALQKCDATIKTLRDANIDLVLKAKDQMDDVSFRRAHHVVTENARVQVAATRVREGKWSELGVLMSASHASQRDDYETSCTEIDVLVRLAQEFDGVYGSRLTGGGFGGCTVTLVEQDKAESLIQYLKEEYKKETGKDCDCYTTEPGAGARLLGTDSV